MAYTRKCRCGVDRKPLDWKEIESITGALGIVWAIVGFAMSIIDWNRERREA